MGRGILLGVLMAVAAVRGEGENPPPKPQKAVGLSDAEKETFLLTGAIVRTKSAGSGVTGSLRATLLKDGREHDAHIQAIDESRSVATMKGGIEVDFRDSYRNNVAAYRLDRLLGLGMVPVTVVRDHLNKKASFTWWVDDVMMSENDRTEKKIHSPDPSAWNRQMYVVRVFDQLIFNTDRNLGNLLIDSDWRMWMIDHSRAFKIFKDLKSSENLGTHCSRELLSALRRLDRPTLAAATSDLLSDVQVKGLLGRRDRIVKHYDSRIAQMGEGAVLYDLPPRVTGAPGPR